MSFDVRDTKEMWATRLPPFPVVILDCSCGFEKVAKLCVLPRRSDLLGGYVPDWRTEERKTLFLEDDDRIRAFCPGCRRSRRFASDEFVSVVDSKRLTVDRSQLRLKLGIDL